MDIKRSISKRWAAIPVSKGESDLLSNFGKDILDFSFHDSYENNIFPYYIQINNFKKNLSGYFMIKNK